MDSAFLLFKKAFTLGGIGMMKNKKLISAILAAASIAGGVVGAQAADLETVAGLVDKHEIKIGDLQTTVDALDNGQAYYKSKPEV